MSDITATIKKSQPITANITKTGPKGEAGNDGADGASSYTYVAYASDDQGAGFSLSPAANLTFIAVLTTDTEIASPSAGDFVGLWTEYKSDIQNFDDLTDVTITNGADNDLLTLESGVWVNKGINDFTKKDNPESSDSLLAQESGGTNKRFSFQDIAVMINSAVDDELPTLLLNSHKNLESYDLVNFTRSGTKTYFDSNGTLQTALANTLPVGYEYNSATGLWEKKGWKIEESRTNLILDSRDLTTGNWTESTGITVNADSIGIDGVGNSAFTVTDSRTSSEAKLYQNISISNDTTTRTLSFFVKKDSDESRFPALRLRYTGGTAQNSRIVFNTKTGSYVTADLNGGKADVEDWGDWWFVYVSAPNNGTGNTNIEAGIYPVWSSSLVTTVDYSATGSIIVDQIQVEQASFPSSPIITEGSQVTRPADVADITDLSWYNQSEGTFVVEGRTAPGSGTQTLFSLDDGTANERFYVQRNSSNEIHIIVVDGGTTVADVNAGTVANDTDFALAFSLKENLLRAVLDGGSAVEDTSLTLPTTDTFRLGHDHSNTNHWNGYIESGKFYPKIYDESKLQSLAP